MSKGSVLVVDDKAIVAKDIARLITKIGYNVVATSVTSSDAIKKAGEFHPDIALMDIKLKGEKDGIDTAEEIFYSYGTPSIYVTAYTDTETLDKALMTHPYGYIVKPFEEKVLEIVLELAFRRLKAEKALAAHQREFNDKCFNFMTILDRYPEYLYISDPMTHEIIYVSTAFKNLLKGDSVGKKCYEVFQGKSEPCDFCTNPLILQTRQPHVWDYYNSHLGRHFLNTDQIIQWPDGREVRFETSIDITDQKKIEKMLTASEAKYRTFIENSSYGFYIINRAYEVVYLNETARRIHGIGGDNVLQIKLSDLIHPDDLGNAFEKLNSIIKDGKPTGPGIYRILCTDGKTRLVETQTFPIWKDDVLDGFHGTLIDVTNREEYQTKLKENSEFLNAIIENSMEGIFVIDEDFNYVLINPASGRILGHDPKAWVGKRAGTNKHPDDEQKGIETIMKVFSEGSSEVEIRVKSADDKYHLLYIRYTLMSLNNKDHILGMVEDITERRKAEQALMASEDKYRSLFENSPEAIIILGNEGKIIECNRATAILMEKKIEGIIGRRIDELGILDPAQSELLSKIFIDMTKGKDINKREMELIMKDHSSKWIEIFPSMITRAGEFYGIQMIARDITDRKLADIEMRKKLLKFNIDYGTLYLSKESNASLSLEVFKELLMVGNEGLLISRKPRKEFQDHIDHLFHHVKVSEIDIENHVKPEYKAIRQLISNIPRGEVIHIDCIEYLISWIGANKTIILIQYLKDLAMAKGLVVLVSIDPNAISEKELRLIEKESVEILPHQSLTKLSQNYLDILKYIEDMNRGGKSPSYSDLSEYFELSKPTARNRIRQLIEMDTVKETQRGRMKILELTKNGKNYLVV